jgi:hypothetical protein
MAGYSHLIASTTVRHRRWKCYIVTFSNVRFTVIWCIYRSSGVVFQPQFSTHFCSPRQSSSSARHQTVTSVACRFRASSAVACLFAQPAESRFQVARRCRLVVVGKSALLRKEPLTASQLFCRYLHSERLARRCLPVRAVSFTSWRSFS